MDLGGVSVDVGVSVDAGGCGCICMCSPTYYIYAHSVVYDLNLFLHPLLPHFRLALRIPSSPYHLSPVCFLKCIFTLLVDGWPSPMEPYPRVCLSHASHVMYTRVFSVLM